MREPRKRTHIEPDTSSADLLISNFATYKDEETRIRLLDRLRKSPDGLTTMQNALNMITTEMKKLKKEDYFPDHIVKEYQAYKLLREHLRSALERNDLEQRTNTNLSIYSPTLGRRN